MNRIRKQQATFFGHMMRREKLEHLVTPGMIEGKRSKGKQSEKILHWTNKVTQNKKSDRSTETESKEG